MFCTKCGAQLQDDAKFCTACGARVAHPNAACAQAATCEANLEEAAPLPPNPSADMATDAHAPETTPNANSADNVSPTHAATNPGVPSDAPAGEASNQMLKSAVKQTTQRSRRRVPLVVLVALALALAASSATVSVCAAGDLPAYTETVSTSTDYAYYGGEQWDAAPMTVKAEIHAREKYTLALCTDYWANVSVSGLNSVNNSCILFLLTF